MSNLKKDYDSSKCICPRKDSNPCWKRWINCPPPWQLSDRAQGIFVLANICQLVLHEGLLCVCFYDMMPMWPVNHFCVFCHVRYIKDDECSSLVLNCCKYSKITCKIYNLNMILANVSVLDGIRTHAGKGEWLVLHLATKSTSHVCDS